MADRRPPRFESVPLRLLSLSLSLSLSVQFDAVNWWTLAGTTFTNSTGAAILQRHIDVRTSDDGWTFSLLDGTLLTDSTDPLAETATQLMNVLTGVRSVGRCASAAEPADV